MSFSRHLNVHGPLARPSLQNLVHERLLLPRVPLIPRGETKECFLNKFCFHRQVLVLPIPLENFARRCKENAGKLF
jgi:hypothetical protein